MPYIIDGHNLIPKVPGISLQDADDEMQLVEVLQAYCQVQRKEVEVFFDNAPPGGTRARNFGMVTARFVRHGMTADDAIRARLERLGRAARNWTVVSSDLAVQASARASQARYLSSEIFADMLQKTLDENRKDAGADSDRQIAPDEVQDWLNLFGAENEES